MLLVPILALALSADSGLTPEKAATIQLAQDKAIAKINKKYGNKKPSELTSDEKRAIIRETSEASQKVLDDNNVSTKDWAIYSATMSRDQLAQMKADEKAMKQKEKDDAAAAAAKANAPQEIPIQRGFSDENPVVMDEKEGAPPRVDTSIPPSEQDDLQGTPVITSTPVKATKTKRGGKRHGGRHRR